MADSEAIARLRELIDNAPENGIVFFGGAGVSTESGIPDFRSPDGLYAQKFAYPPEVMLSRHFFDAHPKDFYDFYFDRVVCLTAQPNKAHLKLAELEKAGKLRAVITQNIDGLHQAAGSKNVLELHGSIMRNYCMDCRAFASIDDMLAAREVSLAESGDGVPRCSKCGGILKPDVVLYDEMLDQSVLERSVEALMQASVLIIAGTSLVVNPAASLIHYFRGSTMAVVNKTATPADDKADIVIHDSIGAVLDF